MAMPRLPIRLSTQIHLSTGASSNKRTATFTTAVLHTATLGHGHGRALFFTRTGGSSTTIGRTKTAVTAAVA